MDAVYSPVRGRFTVMPASAPVPLPIVGKCQIAVRPRNRRTIHPPEAFDESLLNTLGYRLLGVDRVMDAIAIFELNVAEYPDAFNPYDSLGEAYLAVGDTVRAIENYEKSVELDPGNTNGLAVLERIRR